MPSALPLDPPRRLVRHLGSLHAHPGWIDDGAAGAADAWLASLPERLERVLHRWELTAGRIVSPGGRDSLVVLVRRADGSDAVLKLLAPDPAPAQERAHAESAALTQWNGWGAARLLDSLPEEGALLLERLHGEMSLRSLPEAKAMLEAVSAVRRLWVTPDPDTAGGRNTAHPIATVADHTAAEVAFLRAAAPEETVPLRDEAIELRKALLDDPPEQMLLHGDFRQGAVLAADAERARWLAVGPDPLVGERAYDLARLVRDRLHDLVASPGAARATRRRLHKLADSLEVDRDRLRDWALYRAVESGVRHMARGRREDGEILLEFAGWL